MKEGKKVLTLICESLIILLFFAFSVAAATVSSNPADYYFLDIQMVGYANNSYTMPNNGSITYVAVPSYQGHQTLRINETCSTTMNCYINDTSNFTALKYTNSGWCISYVMNITATSAASNQDHAIYFGTSFIQYGLFLFASDAGYTNEKLALCNGATWVDLGAGISPNVWHKIKICSGAGYAASGTTWTAAWIDDVNVSNCSATPQNHLGKVDFLNRIPGKPYYIANLSVWNYTKYGVNEPPDSTDPSTVAVSIYNSTANDIQVVEGQKFFVRVNYSTNGVVNTSGNCFYNGSNLTSSFLLKIPNGTTLSSVNPMVNITFSHPNNNSIYDIFRFRACYLIKSHDIVVRVNGTIHETIASANIPLCSGGIFFAYYNLSNRWLGNESLNVSVSCPDCTPSQTIVLLNHPDNYTLAVSRFFQTYSFDALTYNASSLFYEDNNEYRSFDYNDTSKIGATCSGTNTTRVYVPSNIPPEVSLNDINDTSGARFFSDGIQIEHSNISVLGSCFREIIQSSQMNVTYRGNGTLVKNQFNNTLIEIDSQLLNEDTTYNVSLLCVDNDGQKNSTSKYFQLNDTTKPVSNWNSPNIANTSSISSGNVMPIDISVSDLNLFSINVSCKDNFGIYVFDYYKVNITSKAFQVLNYSNVITNVGVATCVLTAKDSHTLKDISYLRQNSIFKSTSFSDKTGKKYLSFSYNGATLNITPYGFEPKDFIILDKKDRVTFIPEMSEIPKTLSYDFECSEKLYFFDDKSYDGKIKFGKYVNCGDLWADLSIDNVRYEDVKGVELPTESVRFSVDVPVGIKDVSELESHSVGIKNSLIESVTFAVINSSAVAPSSAINIERPFILFTLYFVWAVLLLVGLIWIPALLFIDAFFGICLTFVTMPLLDISGIFTAGLVLIFLNIIIGISGFFMMKR